jgi:hypothetical protein
VPYTIFSFGVLSARLNMSMTIGSDFSIAAKPSSV